MEARKTEYLSCSDAEEKAFVFPLGHRNFPSLNKFTPHRQRAAAKSPKSPKKSIRLRSRDSEKLIKSVENTATLLLFQQARENHGKTVHKTSSPTHFVTQETLEFGVTFESRKSNMQADEERGRKEQGGEMLCDKADIQ